MWSLRQVAVVLAVMLGGVPMSAHGALALGFGEHDGGLAGLEDLLKGKGWYATVDNNAPGAYQAVELVSEGGATCLKWVVTTNTDGQFTGYQVQRDVPLDLSRAEVLRWRWKTSGYYLQIQFWSGKKLAHWSNGHLLPNRWRTETVTPSEFQRLGGFADADWGRITRVGLRIADSFAGYEEGRRYEIGLSSVRAYGPLNRPRSQAPPAAELQVEETSEALSVVSPRYRLQLSKPRFALQLFLPDAGGKLAPVSPKELHYGFDIEKGRSLDARPIHEVVEQSPQRVVIAAAAELPLATRDAILVTFTCLGDRFYTAVKYHTPLSFGYSCTRFAPSGAAVKGLFDRYAFRDESGRLRRGSFSEFEPRAGFGLSTFDTEGDLAQGFDAQRPYLYLFKPSVPRGLAVVYLDYAQHWHGYADNCHFTYYTADIDYFHLGLGNGCDTATTRAACFYIDVTGDLALMDQVIVPEILSAARSLPLEARSPRGFSIRTDMAEETRARLRRLQHTWGNHMHWIGCGWHPKGDEVLASSVDETETMLSLGAAGAVNFDMVGVERLAANQPGALTKLKGLLQGGRLEVVGATYAQPLGSFHGGESNVRHLQWGMRVCQQYLGSTPEIWWEEEYYFFPQLPQLLKLMGFKGACLYFQRTWIEPSLPKEAETSAIRWSAPDGSEILTAAHTQLTRWMPEHIVPQALAESDFLERVEKPLMVEWNELAGGGWPIRAKRFQPYYESMRRLGIESTTLATYLSSYRGPAPARSYRMDETFHGLPLGKCGDQARRADKRIENTLLAAEALSTAASMEGLPYPADAIREAWRNLLIFQGHDVHICEGALRRGYPQYMQAAEEKARGILEAAIKGLAAKVDTRAPDALAAVVVFNPLGWPRTAVVEVEMPEGLSADDGLVARDQSGAARPCQLISDRRLIFVAEEVPSLGYRTFWLHRGRTESDLKVSADGREAQNRALVVKLDGTGTVRSLRERASGVQLVDEATPNGELRATIGGQSLSSSASAPALKVIEAGPVRAVIQARGQLTDRTAFVNRAVVYSALPQVVFETDLEVNEYLDGLMMGALRRVFTPAFRASYFQDWPFGVSETRMVNEFPKTHPFPEGKREEKVRNHVTGLNLLDCQGPGAGLLYTHDGNQGFLRDGSCIANILSLYDPRDKGYYPTQQSFRSALVVHGPWKSSDRLRAALEFNCPLRAVAQPCHAGPLPSTRSWLTVDTQAAILSTFHREADDLLIRLYDVDGEQQGVSVRLPVPISSARLEDLRGQPLRNMEAIEGTVRLPIGPYRICTLRLRPKR